VVFVLSAYSQTARETIMVLPDFLEFLTQSKWLLDYCSNLFTSNTGVEKSYEEERM